MSDLHTRRCLNVQCRVEAFRATHAMPLSGCPVCLSPGAVLSPGVALVPTPLQPTVTLTKEPAAEWRGYDETRDGLEAAAWDSRHGSTCAYWPDCQTNGDHPNPYITQERTP